MISQDLLLKQIHASHVNDRDLSRILRCDKNHIKNLKNRIEDFTTEEIIKLCDHLKIAISEIQE